MASELQFVMHPGDEALFVAEILREQDVSFINGPRWPSAVPLPTQTLDGIGHYCILWSRKELDPLTSDFIPTCNDWYCNSEYATIQFLRSEMKGDVLGAGRIARHYFPAGFDPVAIDAISRRYNRLRRYIKKHFRNSVLVGREHPDCVFDFTWVGPHAIEWLRQSPERWVDCPGAAVLAPGIGADNAVEPVRLHRAARSSR